MIFLIEYDRGKGRIVTIKPFEHKDEAEQSRLEVELNLNAKNIEHEIVLLEAPSEEALRRTHRRYFEDLAELAVPAQ
jgi:hypothetical protein